jgi:maltose alpha-D-glucosyltransferase/alpha-amylase
MLDLWYKNAVIYCLDVKSFMDSDGDGVGDFRGLADRLDHIEALGVTCIWLTPFYPTPGRDNGYDVADYYGVDPRLGDLGDFVEFSRAARARGMKLLVDLVVNHTSTDHPWFQDARDPAHPRHEWYVWSEEKPRDITEGVLFPGVQEAVWTYDRKARKWYMHRFYKHQADLNVANPQVREEILRVMGFWLELGVEGFRVDAAPFLVEYKGLDQEPDRDPMRLLGEMRDFLAWRRAGAILLAEANVPHDAAPQYFGGRVIGADERMHMLFDFPLNQAMWLGLARGSVAPIRAALADRVLDCDPYAQWGVFLRNHDELNLDKLTDAEREEVYAAFAPEEEMRIFDRGIRRRLAPMMGGDESRLALAHSLLCSLPGTPVMWYGDEIGLGDDRALPGREGVRLPMQWSDAPNGDFSDAEPGRLVRPARREGPFGPQAVNVAAQRLRPRSLLRIVQRLLRVRRGCPEIGWGEWEVLDAPDALLALRHRWRGGEVVTLHNLGPAAVEVSGIVPETCHLLIDGWGDDTPCDGPLPPRGWRWLRVGGERR